MKLAEQQVANEQYAGANFSVQKSTHALQVGSLHEASRAAEAQEIRTIIEFLQVDPENDLAGVVAPEEAELLEVRVRNWLLETIKTPLNESGGVDE